MMSGPIILPNGTTSPDSALRWHHMSHCRCAFSSRTRGAEGGTFEAGGNGEPAFEGVVSSITWVHRNTRPPHGQVGIRRWFPRGARIAAVLDCEFAHRLGACLFQSVSSAG